MSQNSWSFSVLALRHKTNIDNISFADMYYLNIITMHCIFFPYASCNLLMDLCSAATNSE